MPQTMAEYLKQCRAVESLLLKIEGAATSGYNAAVRNDIVSACQQIDDIAGFMNRLKKEFEPVEPTEP